VTTLEKDTTEFKVAESAPHFPAGHEDETMVDVVSTSVPEVNEESDKVAGEFSTIMVPHLANTPFRYQALC
jgi:hypothetical protein